MAFHTRAILIWAQHAAEAPATPDAEAAREAAREELSKPVYHPRPNPLRLLWEWFVNQVTGARLLPAGLPQWVSVAIVLVAASLLVGVLVIVLSRYTRVRRRNRAHALFDSDARDSAALARDADAAAVAGDFVTAVVERFRAVIRSLDERGLLEDYPGMTAQEAASLASAALAGARLPDGTSLELTGPLHEAGDLFDAVRYGERPPSQEEDRWMRQLAALVESCVVPEQPAPAQEALV
ncbi:DUF4129 domain-containing protein [Actinomyces weissii]|uniref:DUF4129 domain-containing protein n=1 Tax=Actinomyces weissii TaxID=675090 RepID=A0A7T7M9P7_9ACTO|nr:DUF4129 domain-containing protein [Actinomyces weissii]QQM66977.1 DUF4129 domain-containing protein [Actinomyces weissii]